MVFPNDESNPGSEDFTKDSEWTFLSDANLRVDATERPDSPLLERFFAGYDRAFILPDEREELEGFRACLAINPSMRHRYGRLHREFVMTITDHKSGVLLGGANFLATRMAPPFGHPPVSVSLNYVFVEPAARGRGLSREILQAVASLANRGVGAAKGDCPPAIFIEQNDPLRITSEEYANDSLHAGVDQIDRIAIWARLGARLVDFPYVQPALSADQQSDDGLAYAVIGFPLDAIHPQYFRSQLESFFGISVLKGGDPMKDPSARPQIELLSDMEHRGEEVPLLPIAPIIERLRQSFRRSNVTTLRDFARSS